MVFISGPARLFLDEKCLQCDRKSDTASWVKYTGSKKQYQDRETLMWQRVEHKDLILTEGKWKMLGCVLKRICQIWNC